MELRTVDPRTLTTRVARRPASTRTRRWWPTYVRRASCTRPLLVREDGTALVIVAGHRRVRAAIAAGLPEIPVLVHDGDDGANAVRALFENVVRAGMGPIDRWRAIEALVSADWTEAAIAIALALPVRTLRKRRLLAQIPSAMLDQMARGDVPSEGWLRAIAAASPDEQAAVWKKHKPRKGQAAAWHEIARALSKRTLPATAAKFDDELAQAYGITWTDDLLSPGDQDARTTTQPGRAPPR